MPGYGYFTHVRSVSSHEAYPISIYTELDPEWEEYQDMYEMKQWAAD